MTLPTHLIVGPEQHGVVEYGLLLAKHAGGRVVRFDNWTALPTDPREFPAGPLQIYFTDHLFGSSPSEALTRVLNLVGNHPLSVSFHDVPQLEEGADRFARRAKAYVELAQRADAVVVNSQHEARFFTQRLTQNPHPALRVVPLPLPQRVTTIKPSSSTPPNPPSIHDDIAIMGFIYPGKGHMELLDSLSKNPAHGIHSLRALGRIADGHEWLADDLRSASMRAGVDLEITGFLDPEELEQEMFRAGIPVCAHRHFSASGSLMKWISLGRRVLVADGPYPRELRERWPNFIVLVKDDAWPEAIAALPSDFCDPSDPPSDWTWAQVASSYHQVWMKEPFDVMKNYPLAGRNPEHWPLVSVVIPYFDNPEGLRAILRALAEQDYPGEFECVVADDGSSSPPTFIPEEYSFPIRVERQADQGFRAAAARNLGAGGARGEVLAFVDGDTIPSRAYLREAVRLPALDPRGLVVGRRVHGEVGDGNAQEPAWLRDAWLRTGNLTGADDTSWRFIISAVLTCHRQLFDRVGGFDTTIVGYGGEDWEFGWRAWNAGALFHHNPAALAFHPEPDWSGRQAGWEEACSQKNPETLALAKRITHPLARPEGVIFDDADVLVQLPDNAGEWPPGVAIAVITGWLAIPYVHVVVPASALHSEETGLFADDPRVRVVDQRPALGRINVDLQQAAWPTDRSSAQCIFGVDGLGGKCTVYTSSGRSGQEEIQVGTITTARYRSLEVAGHLSSTATDVFVTWNTAREPIRLERQFAGW